MTYSLRRRKLVVQKAFLKSVPLGTSSWRVAKSLLALRAAVDARWPNRSKASDGTIGDAAHAARDSDHNPWVKDGSVGIVTALDITHDPQHGCDAQAIVDALVASRDRRIKYIIWNRGIISATVSSWVWRPYAGSNPHTKHLHVSVASNKALYDDQVLWSLP